MPITDRELPLAKEKGTSPKNLLAAYQGTVYAALKKTANKMSSVTGRFYKDYGADNQTEIPKHDALTLLNNPNPFMTARQFSRYDQLYLELAGISYWRILRSEGGGYPLEVYLLPPHLVSKQGDKWKWGQETIEPDDLLIRTAENLMNPYAESAGVSSVASIIGLVELEKKVTSTLNSIMAKGGIPSVWISPKGDYADIDETTAERWRQKYRGLFAESGGVAVTDTETNITLLNPKPTDLAALEILGRIEREVCKAVEMPLMILLGAKGNSYASYVAAEKEWYDNGITNRLIDRADFINTRFLPLFDDTDGLQFVYDDCSPRMEADAAALEEVRFRSGLYTRNELRIEAGYDEVSGGDVFYGEQATAQAASSPADATSPAPVDVAPDPAAQESAPPAAVNPDLVSGALIQSISGIVQSVASGLLPRDSGLGQLEILLGLAPDAALRVMGSAGLTPPPAPRKPPEASADNGTASGSPIPAEPAKAIGDVVTKAGNPDWTAPPISKALEAVFVRHFEKWGSAVSRSVGKSLATIRTKGLPAEFIPLDEWEKDLAEDCQPILELIADDSGNDLLGRVGASDEIFSVFNPHVKKWAEKAALDLAQSTLATTSQLINDALKNTRQALADGLSEGDSIRQITNRIKEIFDSATTARAKLIAITESQRAFLEGQRTSAIDSGVVKGFKHLTSSDPCPVCEGLNNKTYGLKDALPPVNTHPGCLCVLTEILDLEANGS